MPADDGLVRRAAENVGCIMEQTGHHTYMAFLRPDGLFAVTDEYVQQLAVVVINDMRVEAFGSDEVFDTSTRRSRYFVAGCMLHSKFINQGR